jgi:hypothetical protein
MLKDAKVAARIRCRTCNGQEVLREKLGLDRVRNARRFALPPRQR